VTDAPLEGELLSPAPRAPETAVAAPPGAFRRRALAAGQHLLGGGSTVAAVVPLFALLGMLAILFSEALPAIRYNGWGFFSSNAWVPGNTYAGSVRTGGVLHPLGAHYGAAALITGTIESSVIALVVGLPIAVGAAILLVERLPRRLAAGIGLCLELLAGVPSAVIGLWGVLSFGPWLAHHLYPALSHIPLGIFRGGYNSAGQGLLAGGLVLAAMIIPIIAATTRDLLRQVPDVTKEGALALGMTETEAFFAVQARWVRVGVIGAAVLGLGRALGETIAIALVSGSAIQYAGNIFSAMTTIAATMVSQLDAAQADPSGLEVKALAECALVLLVITLVVNIVARMLTRRAARGAALPVGAGF